MKHQTEDLRIDDIREVISPARVHEEYPITEVAAATTYGARTAIHEVLARRDDRLVVIVGPCSIHDPKAALEYANRLKGEVDRYQQDLIIVMRVYFEKPRTTVGWKGLINDPDLDETFNINKSERRDIDAILTLDDLRQGGS